MRYSNFVARVCLYLLAGLFAFNSYADEVTIDWKSGTYTGEVSNGVPHGEGILRMQKDGEDKLTRFGSWNNGKEHGKGFVIDEEDPVMFRDEYNNGVRISEN